jgi:hypothetical protein
MTRIAHCCCGSLSVEATGEPTFVGACHCTECQRRTGSPFGVSTYFLKEQVRTEGPSKVYVRGSDSGRKIEIHFCPDCVRIPVMAIGYSSRRRSLIPVIAIMAGRQEQGRP